MKKYFAIILLAASLVACTGIEPQEPIEEPDAPKSYTMTVKASKTVDTKALSLSGNTLNATWTEDDEVKVYNGSSLLLGTLQAKDVNLDGTSCTLKGTLTMAPSDNQLLTLKYLTDNYGTQDGTLTGNATSIDKVCDCAIATVHASVNGTSIGIKESSASFTNQQAIVKFALKNYGGTDISVNPLTVSVGSSNYVITPSSESHELFVAIPAVTSEQTITLTATDASSKPYIFQKTGVSLNASQYYEITVKMSVNLAGATGDITLVNGDKVTGTLSGNHKISIADGATVTLDGATINGVGNKNYSWAGLTCIGDATIILADGTTNSVKGFYEDYPGIHIPSSRSLTIQGEAAGTGSLNASSNGYGAGIGGGLYISCGSISISGGTVTATATGGDYAAGIGSGYDSSCGDITISGGTVIATGGNYAAGIGSGYNDSSCGIISISGGTVTATGGDNAAGIGSGEGYSSCGNIIINGGTVKATGDTFGAGIGAGGNYSRCDDITIANTVTRVTAIKGEAAAYSIGGEYDCCGTVKFGNATVYDGYDWSPDPLEAGNYGGLTLAISTTANDDDTWTLTPVSF